MQLSHQQISNFQETVWNYYRQAGRAMPWRDNPTPYYVLVSEIMLQQTQVSRVVPKFKLFIEAFPDTRQLANAPLHEVLRVWSGLGYNRRAKFLHRAAQVIVQEFDSHIPKTLEALNSLPGVGKNTAGAIMAYAYNQPVVFVETNIRSVYFYHFFQQQVDVPDKAIEQLIAQTLDYEQPRQWYWGLMDYGTYIKQTLGNTIAQSRHYSKQSTFAGSRRQLRGKVLRNLLTGSRSQDQLQLELDDKRLAAVIDELVAERFVVRTAGWLKLTD